MIWHIQKLKKQTKFVFLICKNYILGLKNCLWAIYRLRDCQTCNPLIKHYLEAIKNLLKRVFYEICEL